MFRLLILAQRSASMIKQHLSGNINTAAVKIIGAKILRTIGEIFSIFPNNLRLYKQTFDFQVICNRMETVCKYSGILSSCALDLSVNLNYSHTISNAGWLKEAHFDIP